MQMKPLFSVTTLALVVLASACMKAERLGTDTNSPDGLVFGQISLNLGAMSSSLPTYTIAGTITGYTGSGMVLQNNAGGSLTIAQGGTTFSFAGQPAGSMYSVTVSTPPGNPPQTCSVSNGSGTVTSSPVIGVSVSCSNTAWSSTVTASVMGNAVSQPPELMTGIDDAARPHLVTLDSSTVSGVTTGRVKGLIFSSGAWSTVINNGWASSAFNHLDLSVGPNGNAILAVRNGTVSPTEAYLNAYTPAGGWLASHVASGATAEAYFPRVGMAADGNGLAIIGAYDSNILPRSVSGGSFASGAFLSPSICGSSNGSDFSYASSGLAALACGEANSYFRVYVHSPSDSVNVWQDITPPAQAGTMHYGQSIAVNPTGDILVAGVDPGSKLYTTVRRGGVWGAQSTASTALLYSSPDHFDTAIDSAGNAIAVWAETPSNKAFARFWNTATQTWTNVQIASLAGAPVHGPMVAISPAGYGFVAISASAFIYLYRVDLRDQTVLSLGSISTSDAQSRVHVSVNSRGQAVMAWTDYGVSACGGTGTPYCIKTRTLIQ